jgi:hypothetical protein
MSLMDAPAYDPTSDNRKRNVLIGFASLIGLLLVLAFAGFALGHGWLFSNLGYEHRVNAFFYDLEAKDYQGAYTLYNGGQATNPDYSLERFTEDWTTHSPVNAPIVAHHVDVSKTDGSGTFGSGIIVAVNINHSKEIFMYVSRADKSMTWPAIHELTRY